MLLTLAVFALLVVGIRFAVRAIFPPEPTPVSAASAVNTPADNAAPEATPATDASAAVPAAATATPASEPQAVPTETLLDDYLAGMSLQDKLGQLVMFGFSGTASPNEEFRSILSQYHVGNIVLYGANIDRTAADGGFSEAALLTGRLAQLNPTDVPFLVSIDIEGGRVQRFKWPSAPVSANTLGKNNSPDLAYEQFYTVGTKLREVGINMNLAPVLDVAEEPMQTFLTTRIISSDASITAEMGRSIIEGLNDAACLSTAKHFPGHGATTEDTHATTPVVNKTLEELENYELIPFRAGIEAGVDAVLVAHILYPELDSANIASMSQTIMSGLLRDTCGFSGIIMSDDFRMGGLTARYDVGEAAVRFILAGGDLILCGPRSDLQHKIMTSLTDAAESGILSEARIDESVRRILEKKMKVTDWRPISGGSEAA